MQALVAGGGIGGLAAALAAARAGWGVRLYERTPAFSEVGAGIQLGPNVVKVLHGWGLADALAAVAAFPDRLQVRSALTGEALGVLRIIRSEEHTSELQSRAVISYAVFCLIGRAHV